MDECCSVDIGYSLQLSAARGAGRESESSLERWDLMEVAAKRMVEYDPDDAQWWVLWAQATSKAESIEAGRLILVNALERHAHDAGVCFNLACYECSLGNIERTKECLKRCFEIDPSWKIVALEDERFEAMWESL